MPVCEMCTASYDDEYKFCPYCGRARPEPDVTRIDVRVSVAPYEEATLEIELIEKVAVSEPPFDWRPNFLAKALGDRGHNWTEIGIYRLSLEVIHPTNGSYTPFRSSAFRAFQREQPHQKFSLPTPIQNSLVFQDDGHKWLRRFFQERRDAWEELNQYLLKEGWRGKTSAAKNRQPPFEIEFDLSQPQKLVDRMKAQDKQILDLQRDGFLSIGKWWHVPGEAPDYRYQRPIT